MREAKSRHGVALAAALVLAFGAAACGSSNKKTTSSSSTAANTTTTTTAAAAASGPGKGKPAITMGDKNFAEEYLLGDLYAQALAAKGFTVSLKANIGSSEIIDKALTSGQIQMYPEYTGTILSVIAGQKTLPTSATAAYAQAKAFEQSRGFTLLAKTPFYDSDAVGTLKTYGTQHGLVTLANLKPLGTQLKLAALPEFRTRYAGLVGLKQAYGVVPTFVPLGTSSLPYTVLDSGQVQAADVFTTDPQLQSGRYRLLSDPKHIFGFQNVAPVVKQSLLSSEGPAFAQTLNAVSAKLTLPAIISMNVAVQLNHQDAATVAHQFLVANHLA